MGQSTSNAFYLFQLIGERECIATSPDVMKKTNQTKLMQQTNKHFLVCKEKEPDLYDKSGFQD